MQSHDFIEIIGATEHNLRGVDVRVPHNSLVVFSGVSGSGKSTLAFDTIYQEGQRRYMESLSAYARQFLGQMTRPAVESIQGLSPTLSIDQKTVNRNPRSTVGTITELYDHLRLWMARLGTPHCPRCGREVSRISVEQIVEELLRTAPEAPAVVMGPVVRERKGEYRKELGQLVADGWVRARVDGTLRMLAEEIDLARYERHTIEVVVDRLRLREGDRGRLAEALETAFSVGGGVAVVQVGGEDRAFSLERGCPDHPEIAIPELEPRLFSFNAPQGACPTCDGLGETEAMDANRLCPPRLPPLDGFQAFNEQGRLPFALFDREALGRVIDALGVPRAVPLRDWPAPAARRLLLGDPELTVRCESSREDGPTEVRTLPWRGLVGLVAHTWQWSRNPGFERFIVRQACADCGGTRLNEVARAVRYRGRSLPEMAGWSVEEAFAFFSALTLDEGERRVGALILSEITGRLRFLVEVGLGYLTLDRSAASLSGGEAQRIRLAAQVGAGLQGVTYVLDEPSIGLHPRDSAQLIEALKRLRDRGNTVIVVEHDEETLRAADYVVDVGPGPGREGGELVVAGTVPQLLRSRRSITASYLRGDARIARPETHRQGDGRALVLRGASTHNLDGVDLIVPLGRFVAVAGVSGSGKSTLIFDVLEPTLRDGAPVGCEAVEGLEHIDKVIQISQAPIGRTPRSNPATYTGLLTPIRDLFAQTSIARARGWTKSRFSFNVKGGRCEACEGAGVKVVEMQFLPSVTVPCEVCEGRRFNEETLDARWRGLSIAEVLALTVSEALAVFEHHPAIARPLAALEEVGLGYLSLGQPSTTLSGGEAQRVKLATELHRTPARHTLYLLDEPTTGLHLRDVDRLLAALDRLVDAGHTVLVVEHHLDVLLRADHLIELGPEGGAGGGRIVAEGAPEAVAVSGSPTGIALAAALRPSEAVPAPRGRPSRRGGQRAIEVRGARAHNLAGVDVDIPRGKLTVITGVSGSGKSSLAFDTLFAEGQRRYVESLSTYARRFLGRLNHAAVDRVEGLAPAIAVEQRVASRNPRSTVATVTEVHDVLRLLWARLGVVHCPTCGLEVRGRSPSEAAGALRALDPGMGALLAPLEAGQEVGALLGEGWTRVWRDGEELRLDSLDETETIGEGVQLVVDRLNPARAGMGRLTEALAAAYRAGGGLARFAPREGPEWVATESPVCPEHGRVFHGAPEPRQLSFNSRHGACPRCEGLGTVRRLSRERLFPNLEGGFWSALDGRVSGTLHASKKQAALLDAVLDALAATGPVGTWSEAVWTGMMEGLAEPLPLRWTQRWGSMQREVEQEVVWEGLVALFAGWRSELPYEHVVCPACAGARLAPAPRALRFQGLSLGQLSALPIREALALVRGWRLEGEAALVGARALSELERRLGFLDDVGLGYLALDRAADSLSGGEAQRIRLASLLGAGLVGVIYVLDEPTIGLHPRDTDRLIVTLEGLRDLGNTVLVVEHDPDTIRRADHVIELGPAAGRHGGQLVREGTPAEIEADAASLTGRWLSGAAHLPRRSERRAPRGWITLTAPRLNNLVADEVRIPTGVWVGVSGVSGSGKSSLVMSTLIPALQRHLGERVEVPPLGGLAASEAVARVVRVDQAPLARSPRSTPATYTKILDELRALFAQSRGASERGWGPGRFSYNSPSGGGRCPVCEGRGATLVEMHFLPDVWVPCDACGGTRYNRQTLEVRWGGRSIAELLAMRADEALGLFPHHRHLHRKIQALVDVGLGYLSLGQPLSTLSGGEAQRVKLAAELVSRVGHTVYVLDEPTTGLHMADVSQLVAVLHRLVEQGHTVITVEHNLDLLGQTDWIVEMGPEGGAEGGALVAQGRPEEIAQRGTPTGVALARWREGQ
ncbi:MAG: excinuclease ABC subunit UvrA [Deltaproteobacteria bacterium]|nr:excinuclease ABC subunit UvrA [Deltaproteobacteria bacterium]